MHGKHVDLLEATWREAMESSDVEIESYNQPANSPDLRINDTNSKISLHNFCMWPQIGPNITFLFLG